MLRIQLQNYYLPRDPEPVRRARIYLNPQAPVFPVPATPATPDARSGKWGSARLDISALPSGVHAVWFLAEHVSADTVGPSTGSGSTATRIYRPLRVQITISRVNNRSKMTAATVHSSTQNYGALSVNLARQALTVRLRPVWVQSPNYRNRQGSVDMIIVHRTGGDQVSSTMNQFLFGSTSCHYIIGRDGTVVKMVKDGQISGHAGRNRQTYWGSQTHLNSRSVGIESVGETDQALEPVQYTVLARLIKDLMQHHNVVRHRVLAHSDIRGNSAGVLNDDRIECPGDEFDWAELESKGIGLARQGGNTDVDPVREFFAEMQNAGVGNLTLRRGDRDPRPNGSGTRPGRFGGSERVGVSATPISQLQTWLAEIGYSVGASNGDYGERTGRAVRHFQAHFLQRHDNDQVDREIAHLIRAVRAANPSAD